jgi:lysophospholipid acyltransferase (LPLAT)-like uncharacterized protein
LRSIACFLGQFLLYIDSFGTFKNYNSPNNYQNQHIFAILHSQQCGIYAIENRNHLYSMISASTDGDLMAYSGGRVGIKSIRGSSKRKGTSAALGLINKIKEGNSAAIAIDGPRGPVGVVKKGIIQIAKSSGKPIIPMVWQTKSKNILRLNTWDKLIIPLGPIKSVALYGTPIFVSDNANDEEMETCRLQVEEQIKKLNEELEKNFDEYYQKSKRNTERSKSLVSWF